MQDSLALSQSSGSKSSPIFLVIPQSSWRECLVYLTALKRASLVSNVKRASKVGDLHLLMTLLVKTRMLSLKRVMERRRYLLVNCFFLLLQYRCKYVKPDFIILKGLASWLAMGKRGASAVAFYVTDSEAFAPPKKKAKIVRKTFRLMGLVATSPEELYSRKIAAEEYGEAILLAQHYGLDTDLVYERQWRRSTKSGAAIQDYLGKMLRRQPVLKEVLETLPEDLDSTRALLDHGLRGTDLEALLALAPGSQEDPQLFVRCDPQRVLEDCDTEEEKEEKERAARLVLMSRVNWESLSLVQKDLVNTRRQLLYYRDTLDTLEEILGGRVRAPERFTPSAYARLRRRSWPPYTFSLLVTLTTRTPLENCLAAAKSGDFTTVKEIFASGTQGPEVSDIFSCLGFKTFSGG